MKPDTRRPPGRSPHLRGERGIALVTVVVVLVALTLIATPFALSMRNLEAGSLLNRRRGASLAAAEQAVAAARLHLEGLHPARDFSTPHVDTLEELSGEAIANHYPELLPRDPKGSIRSVHVVDESGKVNLGTAGPALLGNLFGGRSWLTASADESAKVLALASTEGFPDIGFVWLAGGEQVAYTHRTEKTLEDLQRGAESANLPRSRALTHTAGSAVFDARVLLLVQYGWHARQGTWAPFSRVDGVRDLARFTELTYDADTLDRVRPYLTVAGAPISWGRSERVLDVRQGRTGRTELVVKDGRRMGPGTVVQLSDEDGERDWNLVVSAIRWGDVWRLRLLEPLGTVSRLGELIVSSLHRRPVNIAVASPVVLEALLEGLGRQPVVDVITELEAVQLAVLLSTEGVSPAEESLQQAAEEFIESGAFSAEDLSTATAWLMANAYRPGRDTAEEIAAQLVGLESVAGGATGRIGKRTAEAVVQKMVARRPSSHEELADLLALAVQEGSLDPDQRTNILRNAIDPGDARLVGGTAPFTYDSAGYFTITAAASENMPNGRERSRAHVRELVSVSPPGDTGRLFASQEDFERSMELGDGWATRPRLMASGSGLSSTPEAERPANRDDVLPSEDVAPLLADAGSAEILPHRVGTLSAGRPGPSKDEDTSLVTLATVRTSLPGTVHFDEGVHGLTGDTPDGFPLDQSPVRLPIRAVHPELLGTQSGLIQPFFVEFWFQVDDPEIETVLFDTGVDALENRVDIMLADGELSLRVSDGGITDFDASMPDGRRPPAGEIRYGFDDGLELRAGVPYHVAALISGAHDSRLALFVDGVPRGRRVFTTWLTDDVDLVGALELASASTSRSDRFPVESTAGFPDRGVLRVGWEVVEYTDKTEDAFILRPDSGRDPFGGRSRRSTAGGDHEAGETVELMGYSRAVGAPVVPLGNGNLAGRLAEWSVAELDPDALTDLLAVDVLVTSSSGGSTLPLEVNLGTGLLYDATSIPVRALDGASLDGTFQESGGYALLFCDYGSNELTGQTYPVPGVLGSPSIPTRHLDQGNGGLGSWIGGAEVVRYESFDGSTLQGCARAAEGIPEAVPSSLASPLAGESSQAWVSGTDQNWEADRGFVTTFDVSLRGTIQNLPEQARVLVIPLSIGVDGGGLNEAYSPFPGEQQEGRSPLIQIGVDFPEGGGGTEWVRWTTPTADCLVRDDKLSIENMLDSLAGSSTWVMDTPLDEGVVEGLNDLLRFRGQGGTEDVSHEVSETVLPVHVLGGWGVQQFDPLLGIPGRHDATTLIGDDGEREWHVINHAVTNDVEWGGSVALVGFRDPVVGDFGQTAPPQGQDLEDPSVVSDRDLKSSMMPGGVGARLLDESGLSSQESLADEVRHLNIDSRRVTRLVKAPSGEMPDAFLEVMHLGERSFDQGGQPTAGVIVDELRIQPLGGASALVPPVARYRLEEDLTLEEESSAVLSVDNLLYPHAQIRDQRLGAEKLEVLSELSQAGGLLLVEEEIVGYAGLDPVDSGAVFLTGRGLFGTRRAKHTEGAPVTALEFWPTSPLVEPMGESDARVPVADPSAFPEGGGLLWIDEELIAYDSVTEEGLVMPARMGRGQVGLLRGRFGTSAESHAIGAVVRWMPARVHDRAMWGEEAPEAEALHLPVHAAGAFFTYVVVEAQLPDERVALDGLVAIDGLATRHDDPERSPDLFRLSDGNSVSGQMRLPVGRQGDTLDLWLMPLWLPGAFDNRDFASSAWKLGPWVDTVLVKHIQPSRVLEYEEWR
ncbi:MAG: hypothetical protein P8N09_01665 [Planctomycetota bacterium]|nr:hypothetical protein [Planctomycetota bacterium]